MLQHVLTDIPSCPPDLWDAVMMFSCSAPAHMPSYGLATRTLPPPYLAIKQLVLRASLPALPIRLELHLLAPEQRRLAPAAPANEAEASNRARGNVARTAPRPRLQPSYDGATPQRTSRCATRVGSSYNSGARSRSSPATTSKTTRTPAPTPLTAMRRVGLRVGRSAPTATRARRG
ncbi:hypothetical protein DFH08DRAFT_838697 [Mycena albidolilacea]|uniref:Uncharacterized protein n=1 Tax=Mycena albidolilacea TaxID=1033008 RepID=A0AAD7ANX7_9AGAR|nr:hypothetical protein DFH08DRAFT_838697 [Mycena albidolilacea]